MVLHSGRVGRCQAYKELNYASPSFTCLPDIDLLLLVFDLLAVSIGFRYSTVDTCSIAANPASKYTKMQDMAICKLPLHSEMAAIVSGAAEVARFV